MSASIPARGAIGIRKEASFASGGAIDSWQVVESSNIVKTVHYVFQDRIRSTPEQVGGRFSHITVAGPITFPVSPSNPTQWFECGVGGTGPYTPTVPLSSMAIEVQEGEVGTVMVSGDMISRLELSSRQGDILRCNVNLECKDMGGRAATSIPSTAFPSGDDPYLHSEGTFSLDGVANPQITAFSVVKENNLVTDLIANQRARRDILATKAVVTGSISILFEDTSKRNRFFNQLPSRISAVYERGVKSITVDLVNLVYESSDRPLEGQTSYIVETLNFTAYVDDPGSQSSLKITVV